MSSVQCIVSPDGKVASVSLCGDEAKNRCQMLNRQVASAVLIGENSQAVLTAVASNSFLSAQILTSLNLSVDAKLATLPSNQLYSVSCRQV